ncbi:GNAT family N-acetyltransferase [Ructibacterium gallinarum]|uniref:GNAT family N-acetyltransferase n=1 Tax=Ructibacterium gallinarum TaxID=2779355 RepID=A0A9D5R7U5_9FIRM|nr:GNAT family N-acetyltransferase [Ructibacterium gallinarum]MBE5039220.1 GNAT family N-acetyltransferase [Ructibacterium gallinarum]
MIRKVEKKDKDLFLTLGQEFYSSDAVLHKIAAEHFKATFDAAAEGSPYLGLFIIEQDGQTAGYVLVSLTWSNEAGGLTVWIEEIYIRAAFQGQGLGSKTLDAIQKEYDQAVRFRLEITPQNQGAARLYRRMGYQPLDYLQMVLDK